MAEIVNSLFGLSPAQIRQQQDVEAQAFGNQIASTFADPWERQQAAQGAMIGNALVKLGGKLFGLESPELKRATGLESILQQTTQEVGSQDPAVLYPVLAKRLSAAGFTREALQVGAVGDKAKRDALKETSDMMYKNQLTDTSKKQGLVADAELEAKTLERKGQIAAGALQAYKNIADPVGKTRVWNSALDAFEKKGVDVSTLRDIPWEQREATLDSIEKESLSSSVRVRDEIAAGIQDYKVKKQAEDLAMKQTIVDLQAAKANLLAEIAEGKMRSAERIAADRKVDNISNQIMLLNIRERNNTQAGYASAIGTKEFNKEISAYLKNDVGLTDANEVKTALTEFNTQYRNYLGQKDESGLPLYDNVTALNMAKKDIEGKAQKVTKTFAGVPVGSKTKFSGKAVTPKVIKLD